MSKKEIVWNWFIGIFLTSANLLLLFIYAITNDYSPYQIALTVIFLIYGISKIAEMMYYITNNKE